MQAIKGLSVALVAFVLSLGGLYLDLPAVYVLPAPWAWGGDMFAYPGVFP